MINNRWTAFNNFCMWLLKWGSYATFTLDWSCEEGEGHLRIQYTELNSRQRGLLDEELKKLDKFDDIYVGMTETEYTIYCKGV